jgi:hypothetical protein
MAPDDERPATEIAAVATEDSIDAFPEEVRGSEPDPGRGAEHSGNIEADLDAYDRARADDSVAATAHLPLAGYPRNRGGVSRLATAVLALLAAAGWGAYVYERTRAFPLTEHPNSPVTAVPADRSVSAPSELRQDASVAPSPPAPAVPSTSVVPAKPHEPSVSEGRRASPEPSVSDGPRERSLVPSALDLDLSGKWVFAMQAESNDGSSAPDGLRRYRIQLRQDAARVSGVAGRLVENGESADSEDAEINFQGTFDGTRLIVTLTEGRSGSPAGRFVLFLEDGVLRGRFTLDGLSGTVEGHRQ